VYELQVVAVNMAPKKKDRLTLIMQVRAKCVAAAN
jgi:hypothetical protein